MFHCQKIIIACGEINRCMDHVCQELAKVPVRPNVQMQIQSLKKAKQRLESELQECKSNSQLRRFAMLQNDMQVAAHTQQRPPPLLFSRMYQRMLLLPCCRGAE